MNIMILCNEIRFINLISWDESCAPFGFEFKRFDDHVVYFRIEFNKNFVPGVKESIVVDKDLHVKLFYEGSHVPLPEWFRQGHSCKLSSISMLENFPPYIMNRVFEMSKEVLQELKDIQYVKSKGRPPYASKLIRFALMQRYTSVNLINFFSKKCLYLHFPC